MKFITDKMTGSIEKFIDENEKIGTIILVVILALKFMNFNDATVDKTIKKVGKK